MFISCEFESFGAYTTQLDSGEDLKQNFLWNIYSVLFKLNSKVAPLNNFWLVIDDIESRNWIENHRNMSKEAGWYLQGLY